MIHMPNEQGIVTRNWIFSRTDKTVHYIRDIANVWIVGVFFTKKQIN